MTVETATYTTDLVASNPAAGDTIGQGDDHIRLLKSTLLATLPSLTGAVTATHTQLNQLASGFAVGSAAAPTVGFTGDGDSGLYWIGVNNIGLSLAGAKVLDVGVAGLGITGTLSTSGLATLASLGVTGAATVGTTLGVTGLTSLTTLNVSGASGLAALTATSGAFSTTLGVTGIFTQSATSHGLLARGTTAQRSGVAAGQFRYNSDLGQVEYADGALYRPLPIAQPVASGFKNLLIQNNSGTPNTQIDLTADAVTVETTGGLAYRLSNVSVTINAATTGANALDTGAIGNATWYFVYAIYNPTTDTTAGLASTSATAPTMPSGYTAKARLGAFITDGSAHFLRIRQSGRMAQYVIGTNPTVVPNIANGSAGTYSQTSPTLATASITAVVPTTAARIHVVATNCWKAGSPVNLAVAPNTSWGGTNNGDKGSAGQIFPLMMASAINNNSQSDWLTLEASTIAWVSSGAGGAISCMGWEDNI